MQDIRYPIGKFVSPTIVSPADRVRWIDEIDQAPGALRAAVRGLTDAQLDTPHRPEGWTVRQIVHHLPDSHLNAYVRTRLALTEEHPTIKPYQQDRWAELADARAAPVELSLALLEALHRRWVTLLRTLGPGDFARTFYHPESGRKTVDEMLALYAWHGRHHTAQITALREREGW
jgi:uncharacterized damage-inducible protein DinB